MNQDSLNFMIYFASSLFCLVVGHALADYPLQGDFLAKGKNHLTPIPSIPWWICMSAHCLIHAGVVAWITGSVWLGCLEFFAHFLIDHDKCAGTYDFKIDQLMHVVYKLPWAFISTYKLEGNLLR